MLLSEGATIIDFCAPWEVFQDVWTGGPHGRADHRMPFRLYTVAETTAVIRASGGMQITPALTFETAPRPHVLVIPAQGGRGDRLLQWIREVHGSAQLVMSVCTGAFLLGQAGLLNELSATTHDFFDRSVNVPATSVNQLAVTFPTPQWPPFAPGAWLSVALAVAMAYVLRDTVLDRRVFALGPPSPAASATACGRPLSGKEGKGRRGS